MTPDLPTHGGVFAIAATALLLSGCATASGPVPVHYGNSDALDACGAWGEARGADIPVRIAPASTARIVYRLPPGEGFWLCDGTDDDAWIGIIVEHNPLIGDQTGDPQCGAADLVDPRQPYRGPCLSGWVPAEAVILIAS